jgi:multiple sugar transport system ATP-binding protein
MNIIEATVEARTTDETYVANHPFFEVPLPAKPSLDTVVGDRADFGVRPQNLHLVDEPTEFSFDVEVTVTENLGDELLILGTVGDNDVRVRSEDPRQEFTPGEIVHVVCDPARLHLFDSDTGEAIYHSDGGEALDSESAGLERPVRGLDQ